MTYGKARDARLARRQEVAMMHDSRPPKPAAPPTDSACGARAAPPPFDAAQCPIEALYQEHFQQRRMASDMETLAETRVPRPDLARRILETLGDALPHHRVDEDESLFPRLRHRALDEDEIGPLLDRLQEEHALLSAMAADIRPALACMAEGALPAPEDRAALHRFAQTERRHLSAENALVLPLARLRLTAADKAATLAEMRARRAGAGTGPRAPADHTGGQK